MFALCFFFCLFDNFVFTYARLSCRCLREFIVCCSYYTLFCCCYLHTLNSKKSLTLLLCFKLYFCSLSALATLSTLASPPLLLWLPMMHLRKGLVASCQRRGRKGCCCRCLQSSFLPSFLPASSPQCTSDAFLYSPHFPHYCTVQRKGKRDSDLFFLVLLSCATMTGVLAQLLLRKWARRLLQYFFWFFGLWGIFFHCRPPPPPPPSRRRLASPHDVSLFWAPLVFK